MPLALVFSAGAMFGAWQAGVWKALAGRVRPDMIVGASAGAWTGWAIAGGATPDDLIREWLNPQTARVMQPGLHRHGILRPEAMHAKARELYSRYRPAIPFGLVMVEVPPFRLRLVRDSQIGWKHLAAACSIPLCYPPVAIDGRSYVDGGLLAGLPLVAAERMGATEALALNVLTTLPLRMIRKVLRPARPSPALKVIRIEPPRGLGSLRDATVWSRANMERWIDQGIRDGTRAATSITM